MERGVQLIDFVNVDSMIQVHDYKGASMFGRSANAKSATNTIIKLMQDNYPEFLVSLYIYLTMRLIPRISMHCIITSGQKVLCKHSVVGKVITVVCQEIYMHTLLFSHAYHCSTIFKLIRPLLPEATIKKFVVCSK